MVLALIEDLFFRAKVEGAAAAAGLECLVLPDGDSFQAALAEVSPLLVVVDLAHSSGDGAGLVQRLKTNPATRGVPLAAFGPHTLEGPLAAARAAGAEHVWTRGELHRNLGPLLAGLAPGGDVPD